FMSIFALIRRRVGGKLLGTDAFGNMEYYLGMCAGFVRYGCMILVTMALLNARYFSPAEVTSQIKYQQDNFGSMYFPTLCGMQHEVFVRSLLGRLTQDYLSQALIRPTAPEEKGLGSASIVRSHERAVFEPIEKR